MKGAKENPSPRDGDRVFHCGHLDQQSHHFFQVPGDPLKLLRPDGTVVEGLWIVLCTECFAKGSGDPVKSIRCDGIWTGKHPVRYAAESN